VTRGLALAAVACLGGCALGRSEPEIVARAFLDALVAEDYETAVALSVRPVRERLAAAAQRASDQVGGRRTFAAHEMFQVLDLPAGLGAATLVVERAGDDEAVVTIRLPDDTHRSLSLRREDGAFRVVVPLPAEAPPP